jgi:hypothetical protein
MAHGDDLLEQRAERVRLPIVPRLRHLIPHRRIDVGIESKTARKRNLESQGIRPRPQVFPATAIASPLWQSPINQEAATSSGTT